MSTLNLPLVNIGVTPDDGTGDRLRTFATKVNTGFSTLNTNLISNLYNVNQVNSFSVGSVIQAQPGGYVLATTATGYAGVVIAATGTSFTFATSGLAALSSVVPGTTYWLSATYPGTVTTTQPTPAIPV